MNISNNKLIQFILPGSAGERISSDGLIEFLHEHGISSKIERFHVIKRESALKLASLTRLMGVGVVIYPDLNSDIFDWAAAQDDFFGRHGKGRVPDNNETLTTAATYFEMLQEEGIRVIPMNEFYYGGPFEFEICTYSDHPQFLSSLLECAPELR